LDARKRAIACEDLVIILLPARVAMIPAPIPTSNGKLDLPN
jgi:hypothetical protein